VGLAKEMGVVYTSKEDRIIQKFIKMEDRNSKLLRNSRFEREDDPQ